MHKMNIAILIVGVLILPSARSEDKDSETCSAG